MKLLVDVEDGLHVVLSRVEAGERSTRITECLRVNDQGSTWSKVLGIDAETLCRGVGFRELVARLRILRLCDDEEQMPIERRRGRDGHFDALGEAGGCCEEKG